jgi:hypothetical protein
MGVFDLFRHRHHQEPTRVDELEEQTSATDIAALPAPKGLEEKQPVTVKYCASCGEAVNVGTIACGKCGSGRLVTHKTHPEIRKNKKFVDMKNVECSKCGRRLRPIGNVQDRFKSAGWSVLVLSSDGNPKPDRQQWLGTVCTSCGLIFCHKCRDVGPGPCPNCGEKVKPATSDYI